MVALFRTDRFITRMMNNAGAIPMCGFLVGLHLSSDEDDPATWVTPGNLREALVGRGLVSSRNVDDMLVRISASATRLLL